MVENQQTLPAPIPIDNRGLKIRNHGELARLASAMVAGGIAPKGMSKEAALGVMAFGLELGLSPIQALRDIAFINGRPAAYGDAVSGLINRSGLLAAAPEVLYQGSGENRSCTVILRRRGVPGEFRGEYSIAKAKRAGLLGKDNWKLYEDRMLFWRAYTYAGRDGFSDVLKGLTTREEAEDYQFVSTIGAPTSLPPKIEIQEIKSVPVPEEQQMEEVIIGKEDNKPEEAPAPTEPAPAVVEKKDNTDLWNQWLTIRPMLKPADLDYIRETASVGYINQRLPREQIEAIISLANERLKE